MNSLVGIPALLLFALGFLQAAPTLNPNNIHEEIIYSLGKLKEISNKYPDGVLYTPMAIQDECITQALKCFVTELRTLQVEHRDDSTINFEKSRIEGLIQNLNLPPSSENCLPHEDNPEKSFKVFIDEFIKLEQRIRNAGA